MEEDSVFLQSIMEPRGGTMGPGTAPFPSGPPALGDRSSDCLPRTPSPRLQGGRRVPLDFRGVSPADFFWDSGVWLRTTAVKLGKGWAARELFLERFAGGTRFPLGQGSGWEPPPFQPSSVPPFSCPEHGLSQVSSLIPG